jgi:hypothetical protein
MSLLRGWFDPEMRWDIVTPRVRCSFLELPAPLAKGKVNSHADSSHENVHP